MRVLNANLPWETTRIVATWFSNPWAVFAEVALYVGVGLLLFYMVTHRMGDLWPQMPFLVMLAGLLGLLFVRAEFHDTQAYAVYSMSMEWLFQLTYTFTMVAVMRTLPLTTFQVVGSATVLTNALGLLRSFVFEEVFAVVGLLVIGVAYLAAILVSSLRTDDLAAVMEAGTADGGDGTDGRGAPPERALCIRVREVAQRGGLTDREAEVLGLLVQGMSLPAIQQELVVANDTVRTHVKHIYRKLDVHTRQELLALFLE
jgi:DNA-binding CsgD family transcriptional regulator